MTITQPTTATEGAILGVTIRPTMRAEVLAAQDELRHIIDHLRPQLVRFQALNLESDTLGHVAAEAALRAAGGDDSFGADGCGAYEAAFEVVAKITGAYELHALLTELSVLVDPEEPLLAARNARDSA